MEKTAHEIQKERIRDIEEKAAKLLDACEVVTLASINEDGYPRICAMSKVASQGFTEIYFQTSKRSAYQGKATHFEHNSKASVCYYAGRDSVTLIGNVEIIHDLEEKKKFEPYCDQRFFKKGILDPKYRLLKFTAIEATFWIEGKFRTCQYKHKEKGK